MSLARRLVSSRCRYLGLDAAIAAAETRTRTCAHGARSEDLLPGRRLPLSQRRIARGTTADVSLTRRAAANRATENPRSPPRPLSRPSIQASRLASEKKAASEVDLPET